MTTPTPWRVEPLPDGRFGKDWKTIWSGQTPVVLADSFKRTDFEETECHHGVQISDDDAELIVRAVNAHEALLTAAKKADEAFRREGYSGPERDGLRAAISLAEGTR